MVTNLEVDRKAKVHFELGRTYEAHNKYDEAIKEYEESLKVGYRTDLFLRVIPLYKLLGRFDEVKKKVSEGLEFISKKDLFSRNILLNELEIAQGKTVLSTNLRYLAVTLTNRCNLNCIMCTARENPWDLPEKTMQEIREFFPYLEYIMWRGGEVFLLKSFNDLLEETIQYSRMKQLIISNGLLFSPELIKKLLKQPNLVLTISIDSLKKNTYEKIRRGARFNTLIRNLDLLKALRKQFNSSMTLNLNIVVMRENYNELPDFIEFAKVYGFGTVLFAPPSGDNCDKVNIFNRSNLQIWFKVQKMMEYVQDKAAEYNITIDNRLPRYNSSCKTKKVDIENSPEAFLCFAPWQRLCLTWGGNVYPDCMCLNPPKGGVGRVEDNTIQDIWNGKGMQMYRKKIIDKKFRDLCNPGCISSRVPDRYRKVTV